MMLAARGAFLAARRKPKLPYDAEVEYLESTGTQYIDTGIAPSNNTACDISIFWTRTDLNMNPFGLFEKLGGTSHRFMCQVYQNRAPNCFFGASTNTATGGAGRGNWNDITLEKGKYYNNVNLISTVPYSPFQFTLTLSLLAYHATSGYTNQFVGRTRYCRLRDVANDTLVRDFIPVRFTNELGQPEGAMYDRAGSGGMNPDGTARTDGLYRNRGTGAFAYGADKN